MRMENMRTHRKGDFFLFVLYAKCVSTQCFKPAVSHLHNVILRSGVSNENNYTYSNLSSTIKIKKALFS